MLLMDFNKSTSISSVSKKSSNYCKLKWIIYKPDLYSSPPHKNQRDRMARLSLVMYLDIALHVKYSKTLKYGKS